MRHFFSKSELVTSIFIIILVLTGCKEWRKAQDDTNQFIIESEITDLMSNNLSLVEAYSGEPDKLAGVYRCIANDFISALKSPTEADLGKSFKSGLNRIQETERNITALIGSEGYNLFSEKKVLHYYLATEIAKAANLSVAASNSLSLELLELSKLSREVASNSLPDGSTRVASANLIKTYLESLMRNVSQSKSVGQIAGADIIAQEILSKQLEIVTKHGPLIDALLQEMRDFYKKIDHPMIN